MKTLVERTYELSEAAEALRVIEDREVFGKIVVTMNEPLTARNCRKSLLLRHSSASWGLRLPKPIRSVRL